MAETQAQTVQPDSAEPERERPEPPAWLLDLAEDPSGFSFFQAMRRLENLRIDLPRLGSALSPDEEVVRVGHLPRLTAWSSSLAKFELSLDGFEAGQDADRSGGSAEIADDAAAGSSTASPMVGRLLTNFMGLTGPDGPMPLHFTKFVREWMSGRCSRRAAMGGELRVAPRTTRTSSEDRQMLPRFLDLFHHRVLCLLYRGWAMHRQTVSFDRHVAQLTAASREGSGPLDPTQEDAISRYLVSLIGCGLPHHGEGADAVAVADKLHYLSWLSGQARPPSGLEAMLSRHFRVSVEIEEFVGQWVELSEADRCRVGADPTTGTLGRSVVVGERVEDFQQKFRIRLGPMDWPAYCRFLPGRAVLPELRDWVRNYLGFALDYDVQPVLEAAEVPRTCLGEVGRLGWTTWLYSGSQAAAPGQEMVLEPETRHAPARMDHLWDAAADRFEQG